MSLGTTSPDLSLFIALWAEVVVTLKDHLDSVLSERHLKLTTFLNLLWHNSLLVGVLLGNKQEQPHRSTFALTFLSYATSFHIYDIALLCSRSFPLDTSKNSWGQLFLLLDIINKLQGKNLVVLMKHVIWSYFCHLATAFSRCYLKTQVLSNKWD